MIIEAFLAGCGFAAAILHGEEPVMPTEWAREEPQGVPLDNAPAVLLEYIEGREAYRLELNLDGNAKVWVVPGEGRVTVLGHFVDCRRDAPPLLLIMLMGELVRRLYGEESRGELLIYRLVEQSEIPVPTP
jgi:hypothetical protein